MANLLTDLSKIDSEKDAAKRGFLLPYQIAWVYDEHRFKICEKSIRIGMTFAQEFAAVRGRLSKKVDYLHSSVTQGVALQFIRECGFWIDQYKIRGTKLGETEVVNELDNIVSRAFYIEFPNKSRIVSFSSSPNAMRGFGGEVGLDEIAFHRAMAELIKGAGGRALWGDPVSMWSSHNGKGEFYFFLQKILADPDTKWSHHRITILDAVEQGLVETINRTKGTNFTRESFLADCLAAVGSLDAYEEECMCNPREAGTPVVSWLDIQAAQSDYPIFHTQIEGGEKDREDIIEPSVQELLDAEVFRRLDPSKRYTLGWDIAIKGHLASVTVLETDGKNHRLVLLINLHKCNFPGQRALVGQALDTLRGLTASGDKGGLGRESCGIMEGKYPGRFTGVDFSTFKPHLGGKLSGAFADHRIILPQSPDELAYDVHGISTRQSGTRLLYTESKNPVNALSHCDMAWSLALAIANVEDGYSGPCRMEASRSVTPEQAIRDSFNDPNRMRQRQYEISEENAWPV